MRRKRNFLPTFILVIFFWLSWITLMLFFAPETKLLIFIFYSLLFFANFLTFSLIFGNSRRGILISLGIISYLFLNQVKQFHFLNVLLLGGILLSIELYFQRRS